MQQNSKNLSYFTSDSKTLSMVFFNSAGREVKIMAREPRRKTVVTRKAGRRVTTRTTLCQHVFPSILLMGGLVRKVSTLVLATITKEESMAVSSLLPPVIQMMSMKRSWKDASKEPSLAEAPTDHCLTVVVCTTMAIALIPRLRVATSTAG